MSKITLPELDRFTDAKYIIQINLIFDSVEKVEFIFGNVSREYAEIIHDAYSAFKKPSSTDAIDLAIELSRKLPRKTREGFSIVKIPSCGTVLIGKDGEMYSFKEADVRGAEIKIEKEGSLETWVYTE